MAEKKSSAERRARVIFIGNQKGGVGKTATSLNLASALVERGRRVLVIDLDMTGGATKALNVPRAGWHGSYELLTGEPPLECVIRSGGDDEIMLPPGVDLIASNRRLSGLENWLHERQQQWVVQQDLLLEPIAQLRPFYDYIFFDTPPQVTTTTLPAMKASDFVLLATTPERLSVEGIAEALSDVDVCRRSANKDLLVLGIVVCAMPNPPTVLAKQLSDYLRKKCLDDRGRSYKFEASISRSTVVADATAKGTTVVLYDGSHRVADQYRDLAKEFEARIALFSSEERPALEPSVPQRIELAEALDDAEEPSPRPAAPDAEPHAAMGEG